MNFCKLAFLVALAVVRADVSELNINSTPHIEENSNESDVTRQVSQDEALAADARALEDIKFSIKVILRELERLQRIPKFRVIQTNVQSPQIPIEMMVKNFERKLEELPVVQIDDPGTIEPPQLELTPPKTQASAMFRTFPDSLAPEASQRVVVNINPAFRGFRAKRQAVRVFPAAINEIDSANNGYFYEAPSNKFETNYLPPLKPESSNTDFVKQAFTEEFGYEYDRPQILFPSPSNVQTSTTPIPKPVTPEYLPPLKPEPSIIKPVKQAYTAEFGYEYDRPQILFPSPSNVQTTTLKPTTPKFVPTPEYLPPPRPQPSTPRPTRPPVQVIEQPTNLVETNYLPPSIIKPVKQAYTAENGYEYERPQVLFPSPSNVQPSAVTPDKGYNYPKPNIPFEASNTNLVESPYPVQPFSPETGYLYRVPEIAFDVRNFRQTSLQSVEEALNPIYRLSKDLTQLTGGAVRS